MPKGETTRQAIVSEALHSAVTIGVEGITLGPIADALDLSKSGLFAHFRSKRALQLAVIEEAERRFARLVVEPALGAKPGLPRLEALFKRHLDWIAGDHAAGGCVFIVAIQEFDDQPGEIRERLAAGQRAWRVLLSGCLRDAAKAGQIVNGRSRDQLVFEIVGLALAFQMARGLLEDPAARKKALHGLKRLLESQKPL